MKHCTFLKEKNHYRSDDIYETVFFPYMTTLGWHGLKLWPWIRWSKGHLTFDLSICDPGTIYSCRVANCASASPRLRALGVSRGEGHTDRTAGFPLLCTWHFWKKVSWRKSLSSPKKKKKKANGQPNIFKPSYISLFCLDCFSDHFSLGTTCSL